MSIAPFVNPKETHHFRTFYIVILTQTLSLIGSRISSLAIGIWVFSETGNATPLALVSFFAIVPMVLASGISGVIADRWDRRYVMALADAGQAMGTSLLLVSFLTGSFQLWYLYAVTFVNAIFGAFQQPAFQASVTMLIPDKHRDRANAVQQLTGPAAGMIAPIIAGFSFALIGVEGSILIDLITFVFAVAVLLNVFIPHPERTDEGLARKGNVWEESLGGLCYLWSRRPLFVLMLFAAVANFLMVGVMALLTPYVLARTGSEVSLGITMSVLNLGAIIGGVIIGAWGGTRPRIHTMMPALIMAGILLMLMGMARSPLHLAVTAFLLMLPMPMINAPFMSMMQAKVPPDLQGRVFAVISQMSMLLTPIAYLLVGPLADEVFEPALVQANWQNVIPIVGGGAGAGMGLMIVFAGGITAVLTVAMYVLPMVRHLEATLPDYVVAQQQNEDVRTPDYEPSSEAAPSPAMT